MCGNSFIGLFRITAIVSDRTLFIDTVGTATKADFDKRSSRKAAPLGWLRGSHQAAVFVRSAVHAVLCA